ncbi:MAG: acyl-CoA carboxylase epsilon subunit [Streptosporangiaceae bacterium]
MHNETSRATPGIQAGPGDGGVTLDAQARPFLYVVRGEPTDAELAAVVAVLAARAGAASAQAAAPTPAPRSSWSDRPRLMRESISPGPGAWRRSALPR